MRRMFVVATVVCVLAASCTDRVTPESTSSAGTQLLATTSSVATQRPSTAVPSTVAVVVTTTVSSKTTSTRPNAARGQNISGPVGVVGCSNTAAAVDGYSTLSHSDVLSQGGLTAGSLSAWGNPRTGRFDRYWGIYDERRPAGGYTATWVQLCIRAGEHNGSFDSNLHDWITTIVSEIHARDPGIPIWISGVNSFDDDVICKTVGENGPAVAAEAADWAAETIAGVARGPDIGPMTKSHLLPDGSCHPNDEGRRALGEPLVVFFDGMDLETASG